jgi:hypothetical protein
MANGTTTNYGWKKPTVGASKGAWGNALNFNMDGIDGIVHGIATAAPSLIMEPVTVITTNTFGSLSKIPNMVYFVLYVDGRPFFPIGSSPDFSVSINHITWLNTIYNVFSTSTVIAVYTWSA